MSHPNLSNEINHNIIKSEIDGGVYLSTPATAGKVLPVGKTLIVQTVNNLYRIEKRGEDDFYISGHVEFCPEPRKVNISGSTFGGGSMLKIGFVGRGMHLEYSFSEAPYSYGGYGAITTSEIQSITEE